MYKDIYILNEDFSYFDPTKTEVNEEIEIIKQKLFLLLNTTPGEVLNDISFGANLITYIGAINIDASELNSYIREQINKYIPETKEYNLNVTSYETEINGNIIFILDIILDASKFYVVFR